MDRVRLHEILVLEEAPDASELQKLLKEQKTNLLKHLDFYKPCPAVMSLDPSISPVPGEKEFIKTAASFLKLDHNQVFHMFREYLKFQINSPLSSISSAKDLDFSSGQLIENLMEYYFQQRLNTLVIWSCLFRQAENTENPCFDVIDSFLTSIKENLPSFLSSLLESYKKATKIRVDSSESPSMIERRIHQLYREETETLNILFYAYYSRIKAKSDEVVSIVQTLFETNFGMHQASEGYDPESLELLGKLCFAAGTLACNVLYFEDLFDDNMGEYILSYQQVVQIIKATKEWKGTAHNGVNAFVNLIFGTFASGTFLLFEETHDLSPWLYQTQNGYSQFLVQQAFPDVFGFLNELLVEADMGHKGIIAGLFSLFQVCFPVTSLDLDQLVHVFGLVYEDDLAMQFWERDYVIKDRRTVLDTARMRFPVHLTLLRLLSSICVPQYILPYLQELPSVCDFLSEERYDMSPFLDKYYWKGEGLLNCSRQWNVYPRRNEEARPIGTASVGVVALNSKIDGWNLLFGLLDSYILSARSEFALSGDEDTFLNKFIAAADNSVKVEWINHVCNIPVRNGAQPLSFADLIRMIFKVLSKALINIDDVSVDILTNGVELLKNLAPTSSASLFSTKDLEKIVSYEMKQGTYRFLRAILDYRVDQELVNWVIQFILPTFMRWRYVKIRDFYSLGTAIFKLLNFSVRQGRSVPTPDDEAYSNILLECIPDPSVLVDLYVKGKASAARSLEQWLVQVLMYVKQCLKLRDSHTFRKCMYERKGFLLSLASYVSYEYLADLPMLSNHLFTMLCGTDNVPTLVGYFGSQADKLVNAYIKAAKTAPQMLSASVFDMLASLVSIRSSLVLLFLLGSHSEEEQGEPNIVMRMSTFKTSTNKEIQKESILSVVLHYFQDIENVIKTRPVLLASILSFLEALWRENKDYSKIAIEPLRKSGLFWSVLGALCQLEAVYEFGPITWLPEQLTTEQEDQVVESSFALLIKASVLRIVALDTFYYGGHKELISQLVTQTDKLGDFNLLYNDVIMEDLANQVPDLHTFQTVYLPRSVCGQPRYGDYFVYDIELICREKDLIVSEDAENDLISRIALANHVLSVVDAQTSLVKSWCLLIQVLVTRKDQSKELVDVKKMLSIVGGLIKQEKRKGYPCVVYLNHVISLFQLLLRESIVTQKQSVDSKEAMAVAVAALVNETVAVSFENRLSDALTLHKNLLSALLLLFRRTNPPVELVEKLFVPVCDVTCRVLKWKEAHHSDYAILLTLSLQVLSECMLILNSKTSGSARKAWVNVADEQDLVVLLLQSYSQLLSTDVPPPNVGYILFDILHTLNSAAFVEEFANQMSVSGVFSTLLNNRLSQSISAETIDPYIGNEVNRWHDLWCLELRLLIQLATTLGSNLPLLDGVASLIGNLYSLQVRKQLLISNESILRHRDLVEVELIMKLLYRLLSNQSRASKALFDWSIENGFQDYVISLVKVYGSLLTHPKTLSVRTVAVTKEEKKLEENGDLEKSIKKKMVKILEYCMHYFRLSTHAQDKVHGRDVSVSQIIAMSKKGVDNSKMNLNQFFELINTLQEHGARKETVSCCVLVLIGQFLQTRDEGLRNEMNQLKQNEAIVDESTRNMLDALIY